MVGRRGVFTLASGLQVAYLSGTHSEDAKNDSSGNEGEGKVKMVLSRFALSATYCVNTVIGLMSLFKK